jgi:hypothetical protein
MKKFNKILELEKTCSACPTQYEGFILTHKGKRPIYIRYRWGYLSMRVGDINANFEDAIFGFEFYGEQIGDYLDGLLYDDIFNKKYKKIIETTDIERLIEENK